MSPYENSLSAQALERIQALEDVCALLWEAIEIAQHDGMQYLGHRIPTLWKAVEEVGMEVE